MHTLQHNYALLPEFENSAELPQKTIMVMTRRQWQSNPKVIIINLNNMSVAARRQRHSTSSTTTV